MRWTRVCLTRHVARGAAIALLVVSFLVIGGSTSWASGSAHPTLFRFAPPPGAHLTLSLTGRRIVTSTGVVLQYQFIAPDRSRSKGPPRQVHWPGPHPSHRVTVSSLSVQVSSRVRPQSVQLLVYGRIGAHGVPVGASADSLCGARDGIRPCRAGTTDGMKWQWKPPNPCLHAGSNYIVLYIRWFGRQPSSVVAPPIYDASWLFTIDSTSHNACAS